MQPESVRSRSVPHPAPAFAIAIVQLWLATGTLAMLWFPSLRGGDPWFGWLPFWLVFVPLFDLIVLRWHGVVGASQAALARARRQRATVRRSRWAHQAQRQRARHPSPREMAAGLLTALLSR